jgi:ribosome-binding factor A
MKEFSRKDRLADQIKREIADILQRVVKDPNLGFVTITDAELTNDLRYAKVFYSVLGDEESQVKSGRILTKSRKMIQSELARRLRIRNVPLLSFHKDTSAEYGAHMEELFKQIKTERIKKGNQKHDSEPE